MIAVNSISHYRQGSALADEAAQESELSCMSGLSGDDAWTLDMSARSLFGRA